MLSPLNTSLCGVMGSIMACLDDEGSDMTARSGLSSQLVDAMTTRALLAGRTVEGPESASIRIDGMPFLNFSGHNYLALHDEPQLREAAGCGARLGQAWSALAANTYGGTDLAYQELEFAVAEYFASDSAVLMPTGYFCGGAALAGLEGSFDTILLDELAHFNLRDAAQVSRCAVVSFRHADPDAVEDVLRRLDSRARPLLMTDGVFATTGRVAPLAEYEALLQGRGGLVFVDESHAYGVLGANGRGAAEHCGATGALHAGTLSKAFCAMGGIFPCSGAFAARVRAVPPVRGASRGPQAGALVGAAALRLARAQPERRHRLAELSQYLKTRLRSLGLEVIASPAPITAFALASRAAMLDLQERLFAQQILVVISNYIGAGPNGMIRLATFADHTPEDIDRLVDALRASI